MGNLPDVDIREGLSAIGDAVNYADAGQPHLVWNSDEDYDGDPAPRVVMISLARYQELLDAESRDR